MPANGSATLTDLLVRGVDRVEIACARCDRRGARDIRRLMRERGDLMLTDYLAETTADCPHRAGASVYSRCEAIYPALAGGDWK